MKKRQLSREARPGGILRWSTAWILAGGVIGLTGCERKEVASAKDAQMAQIQTRIETLDAQKNRLMQGEVANNFHLPGVGYYHAGAGDFFEHPYGFEQNGRWFVNGAWRDTPVAGDLAIEASRPRPEALKKVEEALAREQQVLASQTSGSSSQPVHHSGMGNALMMYWLLSGSRGMFNPGMGFQQAGNQAAGWQRGVDQQRNMVSSYAASNPGYSRMVEQSRRSGTPVVAGQSVRGGFGSSARGSAVS